MNFYEFRDPELVEGEHISMNILSIETSCDETSLALVEAHTPTISPELVEGLPSFTIKKHLIASQVDIHRPWGGVVPNLAKREHQKNLPSMFAHLVTKHKNWKPKIIAVTVGPGLEPCLWQGIEFAKEIKKTHFPKAEIVPINHLHGHMYSFLLPPRRHPDPALAGEGSQGSSPASRRTQNDIFPAIQLLVSGGHTILLLMKSLTNYKKLGETRDDAAGEAFDKVARMLGLPYPGGPEIERLTRSVILNNPPTGGAVKDLIHFPRPMIHDKNYDFSFSGLKTSVLYYLKANEAKSYKLKANVAAAFQQAVIDVLVTKTLHAAKEYGAKSVILSGGVAANSALRKTLRQMSKVNGQMFISAPPKYQGDNAAMIAVAGYIIHSRKKKYPLKANGNLNL